MRQINLTNGTRVVVAATPDSKPAFGTITSHYGEQQPKYWVRFADPNRNFPSGAYYTTDALTAMPEFTDPSYLEALEDEIKKARNQVLDTPTLHNDPGWLRAEVARRRRALEDVKQKLITARENYLLELQELA